jgi:hypothetical protein
MWFGKRHGAVGRLLLLLNSSDAAHDFRLPPAAAGKPWTCLFDTARDTRDANRLDLSHHYALAYSSAVLLEC